MVFRQRTGHFSIPIYLPSVAHPIDVHVLADDVITNPVVANPEFTPAHLLAPQNPACVRVRTELLQRGENTPERLDIQATEILAGLRRIPEGEGHALERT